MVGKIKIQRADEISVPEKEIRYGIRKIDWERLKRQIDTQEFPSSYLRTWYSILFGITATTAVTIYPLSISTGVPNWVLPIYGAASLFSFLFGICLFFHEKRLNKEKKSQKTTIIEDMKDIEKSFK